MKECSDPIPQEYSPLGLKARSGVLISDYGPDAYNTSSVTVDIILTFVATTHAISKKKSNPPPFLNARDQRRLLLLVGVLAMVIVSIEFASRPSTWYWLTGPPVETANLESESATQDDVDARLDPTADDVPPGGFRVVGPNQAQTEPVQQKQDDSADPTHLEPELFASIRDNSLGIRNAERGAYYKTLAQARDLTEQQLQAAAINNVTFAQMFTDPDDYRGELVTVKGNIKRLSAVQAGKNDFGIDLVYEAWILTPDSGNNPLLLHSTGLPEGIPLGDKLDVPCHFTGYFFKKFGYAAGHGPHSTTLLLGKQLRGIPSPDPISASGWGIAPYILGIATLLGFVVIVAVWRYSAGDRRFQRSSGSPSPSLA